MPRKKTPPPEPSADEQPATTKPQEETATATKPYPHNDIMVPLRAAIDIAMSNAVFLLSRNNKTITAKQAHYKYGGLVDYWERCGYVIPIPTKNGRLVRYSEAVLAQLYHQHVKGII